MKNVCPNCSAVYRIKGLDGLLVRRYAQDNTAPEYRDWVSVEGSAREV